MTTNRHLINDFDVIRPQQLLDKGLPLPFLSGRYVVDEGWKAVITEGGAFKEILSPGTHFLEKYHFFRDVKATQVNVKINTLTVSTQRELTIQKPVSVEIDLDVAVEYQITDPRRVATEITTPLTSLYDRVLQAIRGSVVYATIEEIRTQGEGIARATRQSLEGMNLPRVLGIEIFNVMVTRIKDLDAGTSQVAQQQWKEFENVRDWQLQNAILQGTQLTPQWMMVNRPEIYAQIMAGNFQVVQALIDKGLLDPASFLSQPAASSGIDLSSLMGGFGMASLPGGMGANASGQNMLPGPHPAGQYSDPNARIREDLDMLKKLAGVKVETQAGQDENGVPDGSFDVHVSMPRPSGGGLDLYINCPPGYPAKAPDIEVRVDGQDSPFQSGVLRHWTGQYLIEIAREVMRYFG